MTQVPVSQTQINSFLDCPRKWGYEYLEGKRQPPGTAAQAGSAVHKLLENMHLDGKYPDPTETWNGYETGKIALAMCEHLPAPGTVTKVEHDETFEIEGIKYRAIKDWETEDTLGDYKTTSNLKYALTERTLKKDVQANLSARHLDRDLWLDWTYGCTKPSDDGSYATKHVRLRVLRDEVKERFSEIVVPPATAILEARVKNDPGSLDKNKNSCKKYGGCPFQDECWGSAASRMKGKMGKTLLEKLTENAEVQNMQVVSTTEAQPNNSSITVRTIPAAGQTVALTYISESGTMQEAKSAQSQMLDARKPIPVLYVDCMPLNESCVEAHTLIDKAHSTVCGDLEVHHYKLVEFGKGPGYLLAQLEADIRENPPVLPVILRSRMTEGREAMTLLCSLAQKVVIST